MEPGLISTIKSILIGASSGTLFLSLVLFISPNLYLRIEEILNFEIIPQAQFITVLEGKIDFINQFIIRNRLFFGPLFIFLSIYNIKTLTLLP